MAYFDNYGWYTIEVLVDRVAEIEPANTSVTEVEGELRSNWTGNEWVNIPYKKFEYAETIPVPQTITVRQAREQLIRIGLLSNVQSEIDKITDITQREIVQNYWEYSLGFERNNEILIGLTSSLGLSDKDIDNLFIQASKL